MIQIEAQFLDCFVCFGTSWFIMRRMRGWRRCVLVPVYKNKDDGKSCSNYRGIKPIRHTMKTCEIVVEATLRREVTISEQQYCFVWW